MLINKTRLKLINKERLQWHYGEKRVMQKVDLRVLPMDSNSGIFPRVCDCE